MKNGCAAAYLALPMLDGVDAMKLLAELISGDITPKVFDQLLEEHQIYPYFCSERLCWLLQKSKHEQKKLDAKLASIFGEEDQLSLKTYRDEDMVVLTQDNVEVEFSKGSYQKILDGFLQYNSGKFCFVGVYPSEFEGVDVTGKLVRWGTQQSLGQILKPVFKPIDIQTLAERIQKTSAVHKAPKRYIYLDAEELILNAIKELGHDPTDLPERAKGKLDLRGIIEAKLDRKPPFDSSPSTFDNQWRRVMKNLRLERLERLKLAGETAKKTGVLQNDK